MASIELRGVSKSFGTLDVIHGLDLAIADGEFVALVGPSGCGKSTLLRIIAGLESSSGGEVLIGDKVVNELSPRERNIAMVFQSYALYPHMSVADNMGFNLKLAGKSKAEIRERVAEAARMLDLTDLLHRRPAQLSGGQRQRVAMGRAVVRKPAVFLFDEPLSNLDAKLRVQMRSEIKVLHQRVATTAVYVTHDQIEAMTLADRIVVMNAGRVEQVGRPLDLYRRPENLFVASFIGSPGMNLIPARLQRTPQGTVAGLADGSRIALHELLPAAGSPEILLGLRPEHIAVGPGGDGLSGVVKLIEPTGAQTHLVVAVGETAVMAAVDGNQDFVVGQPVTLRIAGEMIHVFDRSSGKRLRRMSE